MRWPIKTQVSFNVTFSWVTRKQSLLITSEQLWILTVCGIGSRKTLDSTTLTSWLPDCMSSEQAVSQTDRPASWLTALTFSSRQTTADFFSVALTSESSGGNNVCPLVFWEHLGWAGLFRGAAGVLTGLWSVILGAGLGAGTPQSLNDLGALLACRRWLTGAAQLEENAALGHDFQLDNRGRVRGWNCCQSTDYWTAWDIQYNTHSTTHTDLSVTYC